MAQNVIDFFKEFQELSIDYGDNDFQSQYKRKIKQEDFENALGYESLRTNTNEIERLGFGKEGFGGAFHLVLNVKVETASPFIPFAFVTNSENSKKELARNILGKIDKEKKIKYNFTQLLDDLSDKKGLGFVESVSFCATSNMGRVSLSDVIVNDAPAHKGVIDTIEDGLNIDGHFVNVLSGAYEQGICDKLYYSILSFDYDIKSGRKLTQFLIISQNEREPGYFIQVGVRALRDIVSIIRTRYVFDIAEKNRFESIKSAKSAIMSRNMSHNLGSHVMAYLKQQLGSVTSILNKESNVLADLLPNYVDLNKVQNIELPFLVGMGRFIGYLQERQDYIATISTDYIPYGAPVNLKDAIYDELNPDLRFLRHKVSPDDPSGSSNDASNRPANILLNYIAKSEGLSRENLGDNFVSKKDIRFGFIKYISDTNGQKGYRTETFGFTSFDSTNSVLTDIRKVSLSLPGGLVGRQAVFSIFENLIRNAAKHGDTSSADNLDFTIDIINGSDIANGTCCAMEERIADPTWRDLYRKASDIDEVFLLTVTDNLRTPRKVADSLREGLYEDFVDMSTGKMTTANKGIKEMRISAAWLRADTNEDNYLRYDNKNHGLKAPLVGVELSCEGNLRYIFCIRKNKTVAVIPRIVINKGTKDEKRYEIGEDFCALFKSLNEKDRDCWNILDWDAFLKSKSSYTFILIPDFEEVYNELRPLTSNRLLRWKETPENKASLASSSEAALIRVYQEFTGLSQSSEEVFIDDGRAKAENKRRESISGNKHFRRIRFDAENINYDHGDVYLYTTHLSNEKDYIKFANTEHYGDFSSDSCAEGITGDNSSDRLIRREPLDEKWYYSHLYSMKKRVAIIDERIFKMAHNIDESKFVDFKELSVDYLQKLVKDGLVKEDELIQKLQLEYEKLELDEDAQMTLFAADSLEDVKDFLGKIPYDFFKDLFTLKKENQSVVGGSHLTPYYKGKNIDIFTVVRGSEGEMMLVGCVNTSFDGKQFKNVFEKLAIFEHDANKNLVLTPVNNHKNLFYQRYDYISIHQGILDKVYESLKIKDDNKAKGELTSCIHKAFMKDAAIIGDYLPRFVIHSGRAKPTKEDMPQKQPFVQYAAIENAVKDCKIMLVELLDYAKYEEQ